MRQVRGGFTLIEVLVAMAITAVIAVLAYVSLSTVIVGVDSVRREADQINTLNRAFQVLARDIRQVVDRPILDEFGSREAALEGGSRVALDHIAVDAKADAVAQQITVTGLRLGSVRAGLIGAGFVRYLRGGESSFHPPNRLYVLYPTHQQPLVVPHPTSL